jgi:hypothetical protein
MHDDESPPQRDPKGPPIASTDPREKQKSDQKKAKARELGGDADRGLDTGEYEPFDERE